MQDNLTLMLKRRFTNVVPHIYFSLGVLAFIKMKKNATAKHLIFKCIPIHNGSSSKLSRSIDVPKFSAECL